MHTHACTLARTCSDGRSSCQKASCWVGQGEQVVLWGAAAVTLCGMLCSKLFSYQMTREANKQVSSSPNDKMLFCPYSEQQKGIKLGVCGDVARTCCCRGARPRGTAAAGWTFAARARTWPPAPRRQHSTPSSGR